jgi:transposase-like protein
MEKKMRRRHTSEFKAKVALEALKEQKTMSQISQEYTLHANQISDWKKVITDRATELFDSRAPAPEVDMEAITAPLYQQIGQLKVEMDFLKKKLKQSTF